MNNIKGALFDLDGVIVDTAKYHYLAWKRLAGELGFEFTEEHNERLKGVSRMRSLEILLEVGGISCTPEEKLAMAEKKNNWYVEYIKKMDESEILKGAREYLLKLKGEGVKIALGSASKNAPMILENLGITNLFDAVIDGNKVSKAKPDPEVFLLGAKELGLKAADCIVYEDAEAGIEAARRAGMGTVGIGSRDILKEADMVVNGLYELL
ncbi:beta-phosphoglucomutase [Ruminiclostridium cellobioparum]|uniref:beta-phosphoglucomutase n=1 Tax=Ruminiclostridium cellobioparum TaxID=29355 RepID=UPI0028ACB37A|nr:beta-phosphoglucomutase [Ruminiclostridium cellobioparum]